jgi:hypothetical protein
MNFVNNDKEAARLVEIGAIMDSIGIKTVEIAEKLKEHLGSCPGGKGCIEKLILENNSDNI